MIIEESFVQFESYIYISENNKIFKYKFYFIVISSSLVVHNNMEPKLIKGEIFSWDAYN
jgi:hypothetical protein